MPCTEEDRPIRWRISRACCSDTSAHKGKDSMMAKSAQGRTISAHLLCPPRIYLGPKNLGFVLPALSSSNARTSPPRWPHKNGKNDGEMWSVSHKVKGALCSNIFHLSIFGTFPARLCLWKVDFCGPLGGCWVDNTLPMIGRLTLLGCAKEFVAQGSAENGWK